MSVSEIEERAKLSESGSAPISAEETVTLYGKTVYGIALAKMGSREDAEDVFQEVFLTFLRKAPAFGTRQQGKLWFSRTAVNVCKQLWRTKQRRRTEPLEAAESVAVETEEERELILELKKLPKKYREPLELYYFGGLSAAEIAKLTGGTANAVRIRLSRARAMLEKRLKYTVTGKEIQDGS